MILYHGTTVKIEKELHPHKAFESAYYKEWVHLSKDETIAILYSVNPIRAFYNDDSGEKGIPSFSAHFQHDIKPGQPIKIYEIYKGFFEELFNRRAYLYVVDVDEKDFDNRNDAKCKDEFEVMVAKNIPIKSRKVIDNVYERLKGLKNDGKIEIVNYENLPYDFLFDNISSKISVAETQYEADFYMAKFPQFKNDIPSKFRN